MTFPGSLASKWLWVGYVPLRETIVPVDAFIGQFLPGLPVPDLVLYG